MQRWLRIGSVIEQLSEYRGSQERAQDVCPHPQGTQAELDTTLGLAGDELDVTVCPVCMFGGK